MKSRTVGKSAVWSPGDEVVVVVVVVVINDVACVVADAGGRGAGNCGQENSVHDPLRVGITAGGSEGYTRETSNVSFDLQAFD